MASPQYDSSYVLQDDYLLRKTYHNGYIEIISHQYEFSYVLEYEHWYGLYSYLSVHTYTTDKTPHQTLHLHGFSPVCVIIWLLFVCYPRRVT